MVIKNVPPVVLDKGSTGCCEVFTEEVLHMISEVLVMMKI